MKLWKSIGYPAPRIIYGEAILNKKSVYEPTKGQKVRQIVCTKPWAIGILFAMSLFIVAVATIAAFARPGFASNQCTEQIINSQNQIDDQNSRQTDPEFEKFPWKDVRLPKSIIPEAYKIYLHPNISESYFKGKVEMSLSILEPTDFIVFHSVYLNLSDYKVEPKDQNIGETEEPDDDSKSRSEISVVKTLSYAKHEQVYVELDRMLEKGAKIRLSVNFRGSLANLTRMSGFYKSSYTTFGKERYMVSTQFEATHAREAFPCMDEPALKASFSISIVREKGQITLFNTEILETRAVEKDLMVDEYKPTVNMSTYLVAYIVCDFASDLDETKDGVKVRVFAPRDKISMAHFALNAAVKIIEYYNDYFGVPYPLAKQDLIAIPNFAAGAMENWGLITYRDTAILYDPSKSDASTRQWVAVVVAHELAHQWFGNLVTMKWWNDLWLNEGFAAYIEHLGADIVDQEFHMMEAFTSTVTNALYRDSFTSSHPIEVTVKDGNDAEGAFDSISYDKGASLIRMIVSVLGSERFRAGLKSYFDKHAYGNTETKDLWAALQQQAQGKLPDDLTISTVMDTWTKQMGYPVVTATMKDGKLYLRQERFLLYNKRDEAMSKQQYTSPYGYKWFIPFTYSTSDKPGQQELVWIRDKTVSVELKERSTLWVKGNVGLQGFFRVNYDKSGWDRIINQLHTNHEVFSVSDKVGLIDDVFAFARSGLVDYKTALNLSSYLVNEKNYFVWHTAVGNLLFIGGRIYLEESYDDFKSYMLQLCGKLVDSLGWDDEGDHLTRKLRSQLVSFALKYEHEPTVNHAVTLFKRWISNSSMELNNDLRYLIYGAGVKHGDKDDWDIVLHRYQTSLVPSEKSNLLGALSSSTDARVLQLLLKYSLDSKKIKSQDSVSVLYSVGSNPNGQLLAWRFVRENWSTLYSRYHKASFIMAKVIKTFASFNTQFDYDEVVTFFKDKDVGSAKLSLDLTKETIQSHIAWSKQNLAAVNEWLKNKIEHSQD